MECSSKQGVPFQTPSQPPTTDNTLGIGCMCVFFSDGHGLSPHGEVILHALLSLPDLGGYVVHT